MSGHKPWSEISAKIRANPERRARIEQLERAISVGLASSQPCGTQKPIQEEVAEKMDTTFENRR